jgi:hypothetical protein
LKKLRNEKIRAAYADRPLTNMMAPDQEAEDGDQQLEPR